MQDASSHTELAELLSGAFEVHLVDRRGRGASTAPPSADPALELDDLRAVFDATATRRLIGVSSGAILSARLALTVRTIDRLVLFEPPLSVDGSMRLGRTAAFDAAMASGDLPRAMAVAMRISEMGPPWMFRLPIAILAAMSRRMLTTDRKPLARALAADVAIVSANADRVGEFAGITAPTLVVNGTATRPYLVAGAEALAAVIPGSRRLLLKGQHHGATQNRDQYGHPEIVVAAIQDFLA
jgi:pimeloyl-ACP methyl ester carboxylesterase